MQKTLSINNAQLPVFLLNPKYLYFIGGRNTGKTNLLARGIDRMKQMPGATATLSSASYKQILANILPPALSYLERMGYLKDLHYIVSKHPADIYKLPYEIPLTFDNYITFLHKKRCVGLSLVSMDRPSGISARGKNIDFEFTDEFLTFDFDEYNKAVHAANRGNLDRGWEKYGWHHGAWHFSSMPYEQKKKKLIEISKYYEEEFDIDYIGNWKKIVNKQLQLLEISNENDFKELYNEIIQIKKLNAPRLSRKSNTLFILSNAFDNPMGGGFKWVKEQYETATSMLIFRIEIMNEVMDQVEDSYYFLDERHEYKNAYNYDFIDTIKFNVNELRKEDCRQDADRLNSKPLLLSFDWGGVFSGLNVEQIIEASDIEKLPVSHFLVKQWQKEKQKLGLEKFKIINFINEFYIKPPKQMVKHLAFQFIEYYKHHACKKVTICKDKHGDLARNQEKSWNDEFIDILKINGWNVDVLNHYGNEPAHQEVYKLINNILREVNPERYPIYRFNTNRCKNTLISMKNARVKETEKGLKKDKSSEHQRSGVDPLYATHFSDSVGKFTYTYIPKLLQSQNTSFIDTRI